MLWLLLPALLGFVSLIALFFYLNWSQEILDNFRSRLQSIVSVTAQVIPPQEVEWINQHLSDIHLEDHPDYQYYRRKFVQLKQHLPVNNLYIVRIEPVKKGDPVLLNDPSNPINQIYKGKDLENAYRQVFLIDINETRPEDTNAPGDFDFSETGEHQVYYTKKAFVTAIYEARKTQQRFMSAYAPIVNDQGRVIALLGADLNVQEIDQKLRNALLVISLVAAGTVLLATATIFFIADRISKPVQQLNQAALEIAAGNYETDIHVEGPKEIVELANTLNTMSECLEEHISRLRESSLIRERMYGEYECTLLLQHYMLHKVIEDFKHPHLQIRLASANFAPTQRGTLLKLDSNEEIKLTWIEARGSGFAFLYELSTLSSVPIKNLTDHFYIECQFIENDSAIRYKVSGLLFPFVWSIKDQRFIYGSKGKVSLQSEDMIFLFNSEIQEYFGSQDRLEGWLSRVLRHFAEDGLDTIQTMLTNELNFLLKREQLTRNFQILSLQNKKRN
jgi:HAMP domain-containing protein